MGASQHREAERKKPDRSRDSVYRVTPKGKLICRERHLPAQCLDHLENRNLVLGAGVGGTAEGQRELVGGERKVPSLDCSSGYMDVSARLARPWMNLYSAPRWAPHVPRQNSQER